MLAAGEAEPRQGTEDPARGFCITHNSRTELLITLMTGVAAVEFQLLWVLFFWFILWVWKPSSRCCPVLCTVCPLALWTEEETASLPLGKGGWPLPAPQSRAASPDANRHKRGGKRPCLSCDISAGLMTNAGSAPHPLEIR